MSYPECLDTELKFLRHIQNLDPKFLLPHAQKRLEVLEQETIHPRFRERMFRSSNVSPNAFSFKSCDNLIATTSEPSTLASVPTDEEVSSERDYPPGPHNLPRIRKTGPTKKKGKRNTISKQRRVTARRRVTKFDPNDEGSQEASQLGSKSTNHNAESRAALRAADPCFGELKIMRDSSGKIISHTFECLACHGTWALDPRKKNIELGHLENCATFAALRVITLHRLQNPSSSVYNPSFANLTINDLRDRLWQCSTVPQNNPKWQVLTRSAMEQRDDIEKWLKKGGRSSVRWNGVSCVPGTITAESVVAFEEFLKYEKVENMNPGTHKRKRGRLEDGYNRLSKRGRTQ
ncbi:hypothetical protein DL96DRAFT_1810690 [Flagelloscypha sp. PMI_526]|nr:hypothetical protein DL96DRAFT_1810690 [Flagelloscypha sp. PMI_526]